MNDLKIRFFEELNDFLPDSKKKQQYGIPDYGKRSVKDLVESQGVPHTEVDLIFVNGKSVNFDFLVEGGDLISVYPVFEKFNITGNTKLREHPLRNLRFILDVHLGKLAKYMRMLGFDSRYDNRYEDEEISLQAYVENRVLLTRDIGLLKRRNVIRGYWLRSQQPKKQLQEILIHFDLVNNLRPLSRCMKCNGNIERANKGKIYDQLLPDTRQHFNQFYQCTNCGKIYWKGSHFDKIMNFVDQIRKLRPSSPPTNQ